jgi:hypothetical protein
VSLVEQGDSAVNGTHAHARQRSTVRLHSR